MEKKLIDLQEGKYIIRMKAVKSDSSAVSAMDPYVANNCVITKTNHQTFITLQIKEHEVVKVLQLIKEDGAYIDSLDQHIDYDSNIRYEIFPVESLQTLISARVQYKVPHGESFFEGDETLRLYFDETTLQSTDELNL